MQIHASALAVLASVSLCSSIAQAETKAERPKLILNDLIGFGTSGVGGWLSYRHSALESPRAELGPNVTQLASKSTSSALQIQPRFEVLLGTHVSLGGELGFQRFASGYAAADDRYASSSESKSYTFTVVPMLGLRLPLPRKLSAWAHAGFGGGVGTSKTRSTSLGSAPIESDNEAVLLTRVRADVRLGYEPIPGLMLTLGPELTHVTQGGNGKLGSGQGTAIALFGGVSLVIR